MRHNVMLHHINATGEDLAGNNGIGRYILLPGSDGRAKDIAQHFNNLTVKSHPRGHHLYLGTINDGDIKIEVATISSGMGCSSMEIILHELLHLGGKRFLRVGTAGSLQPDFIHIGDIINVQGAVRDEQTTLDYVPVTIPAIASIDANIAILQAAKQLELSSHLHTGIVHCKSSLYAREFGAGPQAEVNRAFMQLLTQCGILASEMETSALFIQSQLANYELMQKGQGAKYRILAGAILGIVSVISAKFASAQETEATINNIIHLALQSIKTLAAHEL